MSYEDFTLDRLSKIFGLTIETKLDLCSAMIQPFKLDEFFMRSLDYSVPLGLTINTEKSRSEMIIAPILLELKKQTQEPISLFSGTEFNVDSAQGLNGYCDFVVSLSSQQLYISSPVLMIVEAKKENIIEGLGQCIAAMLAAQVFNQPEFGIRMGTRKGQTR
jgi:hypothetical protein